ncbi:MoxR family ATPase [Tessaracoccus sp. OH4464_COT-324]|uniref:AAA family ATPase n=1 Tax=Tessaracoccus sp. OH4464_COT-324 TaxID=2491059 RepID=UPI000F62D31A|nr:MoxR family ATPase [Tessaracoccus sp. OH4464_COT-324]RRD47578.1 MoxR family ATPase [Tessaracoccus sp. OH4464_COT-324]
MDRVIEGKRRQVRTAVTVLLAGGHLLLEDVPGVGKTVLAKALGRSISGSFKRIQFTPDLLPSDITGVSVFNQNTREFEFKPGGIFANIVLGDEINRASPKTQSALLEAMAERQVSADGRTYRLAQPFMVIATQNPIEMEGTFPLPEAQRDRFMARISMGYPGETAESRMLLARADGDRLGQVRAVTSVEEINQAMRSLELVYVSPAIADYIVQLCSATRAHPSLRLGASPRASLHLMQVARVVAALAGRDYVIPEDATMLAVEVLAHRVLPTVDTHVAGRSPEHVISEIVNTVSAPRGG